MDWLNYHHLLYFWTVAREGGLRAASRRLHVTPSTVSGQLRALEESLEVSLFHREGRRLVLTEAGRLVFRYADEIFSTGRDLLDALRAGPGERSTRLDVGICDVVPKQLARALLTPVLQLEPPVRVVCREESHENLLGALAIHELDVVISDVPVPPGTNLRLFHHPLGQSGVTLLAAKALATRLQPGFPESLDGAPMLMPARGSNLRRNLEQWLDERDLRPQVRAELDDSALLKSLGQDGHGAFPVPTAIEATVRAQLGTELVGHIPTLSTRFYAITTERRLTRAPLLALRSAAREALARGED